MINLGIVVIAHDIEEEVITRFTDYYKMLSPDISYKLFIIAPHDELFTWINDNRYFNKCRALNYGIQQAASECEVIVCTDIDVIPLTSRILEQTYYKALYSNKNILIQCRNVDLVGAAIKTIDSKSILKVPYRYTYKGCWNAMNSETWYKSGGWNEELYGYGGEDNEFINRLILKSIPIETITNQPLIHVSHPKRVITPRLIENTAIANSQNFSNHSWLIKQLKPSFKPTILTSGDKALGLGDAFILAPTLVDLAKKYKVRHIATPQSYNILKYLDNGDSLRIFDMNRQGHFYTNDHVKTFNLVYWDYENTLRFGKSSIDITRNIAGLDDYVGTLPEIPIPQEVEDGVKQLFSSLKKPIIIVQPFMSFWNKMITPEQQIAIVDGLLKKNYTVIQISGQLPPNFIHPDALSFIGKTSLDQSRAMIKYADCFFGMDSFGQHCAANVKTPAVVIWGCTNPVDFGYPFHINIVKENIATCMRHKASRPMR